MTYSFDIWCVPSPRNLNQLCSNDPHGIKTGPSWGSQVRTWEQKMQTSEFFFPETGRPCPGGHKLNIGTKHNSSSLRLDSLEI